MKTLFNSERMLAENNNTCENTTGVDCGGDCSEIILMSYLTTFPLVTSSAGFSQDTLREVGERGNTEGEVMNTGSVDDNNNGRTVSTHRPFQLTPHIYSSF